MDYMKDFRESGVPAIGISLLQYDHKTVHEKRFIKSSSLTSVSGSKISSHEQSGEQGDGRTPELGISLM